jgi:MFS family permease
MESPSDGPRPLPRPAAFSLVLAQFVCSFAATSTNVAIKPIAADLGTDVTGVQAAITLFTLTMAALMIPGSKLSDILGRKFCFGLGLLIYGVGAILAALAPSLVVLIGGYSLLQGIGTALLIPPVYIFATVMYTGVARARAFAAISAAAGVGAATGPLVGGLITSLTSWRVTFLVQALIVLTVFLLGRQIADQRLVGRKPAFDVGGAVLSGAGLFFVVVGILLTGTFGWLVTTDKDLAINGTVLIAAGGVSPVWLFVLIGLILLAWFFRHIAARERAGDDPLLPTRMFRNRIANLGLLTQNMQWLILQGLAFVVSVFLQTARGFGPIETGLILTPATIGILLSSSAATRMAQRRTQALIIRWGFIVTIIGLALLLLLGSQTSNVLFLAPGLLVTGFGTGMMLTASVNVVQSTFPEHDQGEISGLSRSISNLGSSLGVAIAGSVIVSGRLAGDQGYVAAVIVLALFAGVGLLAAARLPAERPPVAAAVPSQA